MICDKCGQDKDFKTSFAIVFNRDIIMIARHFGPSAVRLSVTVPSSFVVSLCPECRKETTVEEMYGIADKKP